METESSPGCGIPWLFAVKDFSGTCKRLWPFYYLRFKELFSNMTES